ncbi:hypothetical protein GQ464_013840 [Rhodocaloribacter litoris]|uniref:hypothetical protein n=1 Tax=Rhodocaloribacter litoris TaxID=2558931 RepID=UPI0014246AE3|nr:hypothetical protein [Rhodocaloribacter litoris]QXD14504.1 hypothetical protein GQ464_013840 [Rhodocaloribacter litoris]
MPQTLLAFVAMMLMTTYSVSVQRQHVFMQQRDIAREIEEMAGSVALEAMEIIRTRAFDQAVLDSTVTRTLSDVDLFSFNTAQEHFTTGRACSVFGLGGDVCDDIDDFHRMQTATVPFPMGTDTLYFTLDVEVMYVDENFERHDAPTFHKAVTVSVQDTWPGIDRTPFLNEPVRLSRVFAYEF